MSGIAVVFLPRMTLFVSLLKVGDSELRIVFQGLQGLVAEQLLDVVEIGSTPDQLGCAAPPERVGRHVHPQPRLLAVVMKPAQRKQRGPISSFLLSTSLISYT